MTRENAPTARERLAPRRWPIRLRSSVTAAVVVCVAVILIGTGALWGLRWSVTESENSVIANRAVDIANALVSSGPGAAITLAAQPSSQVDVVQLHRIDGQILAMRPGTERSLADVELRDDGGPQFTDGVMGVTGTEYRVLSLRVVDPATRVPYVLYIGTETGRSAPYFDFVRALIIFSIPLSGLAAGVVTWFIMRRALSPVERMRRRVAEISTSDLGERVPVPETRDEIARLADTMNEMLARLDQGREQQVAFVGDASHELRSPLSTLSAMLELSSTSGEPVDVETVNSLLLPEVERMRAMVEDLLLLAKSDERGAPLHAEEVDLDDIVLAEASRLRSLGNLSVGVDFVPARVLGDGDALVRVVRNLADNARRHAVERLELSLTVAPGPGWPGQVRPGQVRPGRGDSGQGWPERGDSGSHVGRIDPVATAVLTVDDDGPGVPPEQRANVFDRFARLDYDRSRNRGGSGLGLAIVAEIVQVHGGRVAVDDSPLGGARFIVELPCQSAPGGFGDDD